MSLRVRNFETARLKVSDADGNPVEIAAVVVYRVVDSFKALFAVDDHVQYVAVQAETAVRHLATSYPYEAHDDGPAEPARQRRGQRGAHRRAAGAGRAGRRRGAREPGHPPGVRAGDRPGDAAPGSRPTRSWRPGPRSSRARSAWSAWRWSSCATQDVVELDEERKAQMVSNLLVVLCGDRAAQPVVNAGTLYG